MRLIEIGPSFRPILPKRDGWNTTVVDHAPREALIEKYASQSVDVAEIEDVDIIWHGGDLSERSSTDSLGTFHAILASHVLEHMPDPITFLQSARRLIRQDGVIILALPDKRYTFDFFGPMTNAGDWLTAHAVEARTHAKRVAFNHVAYSVSNSGRITWTHEEKLSDLRFAHSLTDALVHFDANTDNGTGEKYHDYHAWRLTPASFSLLILETSQLVDMDLRIDRCTPTLGHEFFAFLVPGRRVFSHPDELNALRICLLKATIGELRHATDLLLGVL